MYSQIQKHSFYQTHDHVIPQRILNCMIDKAMHQKPESFPRLDSTIPKNFGPHVDPTRIKCAFGKRALPKLLEELSNQDPSDMQQIVATIGDMIHDPEKLVEAIHLEIPQSMTKLLVSENEELRGKVALIFKTIAGLILGRDLILNNPEIILNLITGLKDPVSSCRIYMAEAVEMLSRTWMAAEKLCTTYGLLDIIVAHIVEEEMENILVVDLKILQLLLDTNIKIHAIEIGTLEKLTMLLKNTASKSEALFANALACLAMLCEEDAGKSKALGMNLLETLKIMLDDCRVAVRTKAATTMAFLTTTEAGKRKVITLDIIPKLLTAICKTRITELLLMSLKIFHNVAEIPEGKKLLSCPKYLKFIKNLDTLEDEAILRHKKNLLKSIHCF